LNKERKFSYESTELNAKIIHTLHPNSYHTLAPAHQFENKRKDFTRKNLIDRVNTIIENRKHIDI